MSRPPTLTINSGQESWDVDVSDNFTLAGLGTDPMIAPQFDPEATLPDPTLWDRCIAVAKNTESDWCLFISDGIAWKLIPKQAAVQAAASGWSDATAQNDFNALLTKMKSSGVMDT